MCLGTLAAIMSPIKLLPPWNLNMWCWIMYVFPELISPFNWSCHTFACSCFGEVIRSSLYPSLRYVFCFNLSPCVSLSLYLSGVPGFQCVGPVCHQVHAKRDIQSASLSTEVTAVCHGGCGRAEQPFPVSTAIWHCLYCVLHVQI